MIDVTYDGKYSLTVTGHAGQAPLGQDIVCAGASTLICALAEMLAQHRADISDFDISLESGDARVAVKPTFAFVDECLSAFETAVCGYRHLANTYPSYIRLLLR